MHSKILYGAVASSVLAGGIAVVACGSSRTSDRHDDTVSSMQQAVSSGADSGTCKVKITTCSEDGHWFFVYDNTHNVLTGDNGLCSTPTIPAWGTGAGTNYEVDGAIQGDFMSLRNKDGFTCNGAELAWGFVEATITRADSTTSTLTARCGGLQYFDLNCGDSMNVCGYKDSQACGM